MSPLHFAIYNNRSLHIIKLLIKNKADINEVVSVLYDSKSTLLSLSVVENNFEVFKFLIDKGADMNKANSNGTTALTLAQQNNRRDILNYYYFTLLKNAIASGKLDKARQLLEDCCVDICTIGSNDKTVLMIAVEKGNLEAIKLLFEFGADLTMQTALLEAINVANIDIINFFIENKVEINYKYHNGLTPLIKAFEKGSFEVVKSLMENEADVNFTTAKGSYPLFESLKFDNNEITKYLINKGAKIDAKCLYNVNSQFVKNLMKIEVDLKNIMLDDFEHCTLLKAIETKNVFFVKYLLGQGLAINFHEKQQINPLVKAAQNRSFLIVKMLVDAGADIDSAKYDFEAFACQNDDFNTYYQKLKQELAKKSLAEGFGDGCNEAAD